RRGSERSWADSVWRDLEVNVARSPTTTLEATSALADVYARERDTCMLARLQAFRCISFDQLGQLDSAMAAMQRSFAWFRPGCDSIGLMRAFVGQTNVYLSLGEFHLVDSVCTVALGLWNASWNYTAVRNALLTNRAIARASSGDLTGALGGFREVLALAILEKNDQVIDDAYTNLGVIKGMMGQPDSSEYFNRAALNAAKLKGNKERMSRQMGNLASLAIDRGDVPKAIELLDSAYTLAREINDLQEQVRHQLRLSQAFLKTGDNAQAYAHLQLHLTLKDSLLNIEKVHSLTEMQEKYESEKKAKEIKGLQVEKLDADLRTERARRTRNIYLFSGIGVLLLSVGLWNRLRFTRRSHAAIQKEKDISEGLLLNILPEEVAAELKVKGYADAKEFGAATILFSDFKGFTELSEKLTASELIEELNICFKAFDGIMGQYHIEKIKTIGDAYMAAGGLPDTTKGSPADVLMAALDMQAFMHGYAKEREAQNRPHFTMRVGLHSGPVIAGIVGVKKFAYDIWGDTVNTASRMESSGEVGRVNISNASYLLVKDDPRFSFTSRGMVSAKGKGEMEMWFAERRAA
ncbi:MAG: adenylate/guanylate cyclase domain-containing protein, partial [Flavobacteriales bacterium]